MLFRSIIRTDQLISITEANQNFSKTIKMVEKEGRVVVMKNNHPRFVIFDLISSMAQPAEFTEIGLSIVQGETTPQDAVRRLQSLIEEKEESEAKLSLDEMLEKMASGGVWVLNETSDPMKAYTKKHHPDPDEYNKEIVKYETPQKYIKRGNKIIVVSLTENIWGGIRVYDEGDVYFRDPRGNILVALNKKRSEREISAADYQEVIGEETTIKNGVTVSKSPICKVKDEFKKKMLDTGYINEEEYEFYSNPENRGQLTRIKTINIEPAPFFYNS